MLVAPCDLSSYLESLVGQPETALPQGFGEQQDATFCLVLWDWPRLALIY